MNRITPPHVVPLDNASGSGTDSSGVRHPPPNAVHSDGDGASSSGSDNDDDEIDRNDSEETSLSSKCLFCEETSSNPTFILTEHLKCHGLDFVKWQETYKFDQLEYIRFVNYFREMKLNSADVDKSISDFEVSHSSILRDDKYLTPVVQDDGLLVYFIEENDDPTLNDAPAAASRDQDEEPVSVLQLKNQIEELKRRHAMEIEHLSSQLAIMKGTVGRVLNVEEQPCPKPGSGNSANFEEWYFDSYDQIQIHTDMLKDKARTEAYMHSILNNRSDFEKKVVLDVGCGTGILSMFAAKAGARKVFAIDNAKIILEAMDIVKENGLQGTVECVAGKVEESTLLKANGIVDIIISEWMGYFLLQEAMLNSVLYARDNYLKKGGLMFPNGAALYIVGVDNQKGHHEAFDMWDDVYGFKMTAMKIKARNNTIVEEICEHEVVTNPAKILDLDLTICSMDDTLIDQKFVLTVKRDCIITSLVGYFDVSFTMGSTYSHTLKTGPDSVPTHWNQTIFQLSRTFLVREGANLRCHLKCRPSSDNERLMDIHIEIEGHSQRYELR